MRRTLRDTVCLLVLIVACTRGERGPVPIAYDKEACAYCRMLIGDPRYAAQLVTADGEVLNFDDPGCLLRFVHEEHPRTRAIWFRDSQRDRWLAAGDTGFVHDPATPMGFGLAAVDRATNGALTYDEAGAKVVQEARAAR